MEPDQNNRFQRKIEPINEDALRQELASTQPITPSPAPLTPPEVQETANPALVDIGYNLQIDPTEPVLDQPSLSNQQPTPSNDAEKKLLDEFDKPYHGMWRRAIIVGAIVSVALIVILHIVSQIISSVIISSVQSALSSGASSLSNANTSIVYVIPYLTLFITIIIGMVVLGFVNLAHRRLYLASMLIIILGLFAVLFVILGQYMSVSLDAFLDLQYLTSLSGLSSPLVYIFSPVIGAGAGLITIILISFVTKRLPNKAGVLVILLASLVPMGIALFLELGTQNHISQINSYNSTTTKVQSSSQNAIPTTTPVSSSASTTQTIAYQLPVLDGSGKYNDGNISFTYPVSGAYGIGKLNNWGYDNEKSYSSLFSADYANDLKTYAIIAGAEIRITHKNLHDGDFQGSTGPTIRDYEYQSDPYSTIYDIKTTDGSYAFGVNSNSKTLDIELFGAYFIKNMTEYYIMYNGAPSDISKYKPQFDAIVSSFKFLK